MAEPDLQPGETVERVIRAEDRAILRSAGVATLIAGIILGLIAWGEQGFDGGRFVIAVALFGAVILSAGWLMDRGREWVLTDRRIIAPGGRSLDLDANLRIRRLIYALKLSQRGHMPITIRGVSGLGAVSRQITEICLRNSTGGRP
ncbi:hypothetical protein MLD63_12840 [Paracoccus sp. TK19116]|uniref:PH domain-containing protein n=1 Tax=Paracoccus albicereus TaxID=2922394 RepID=A0ABT1MSL0_9RHOB|nr:hypothetical protein [Paracoccus albicereus]MCQ0971310.1 hypothetical protein [Paracoccus albicereus]